MMSGGSYSNLTAKGVYRMKTKRAPRSCICASVVSGIFLTFGIAIIVAWPYLLDYLVNSNLVLKQGSHTYDLWKKFPEDFVIDFYFFNWTNPDEVNNNQTKPIFREMGPYRFRETKEKANIVWNQNGTVTYQHLKYWFETEMGNLDEMVTTINPIAVSAAYTSRDWNFFLRKGLSMTLSSSGTKLPITRPVRQLLFEGYPDPLLTLAKTMPFGSTLPPWDRFGWFYTRNGSSTFEGTYNMGTGEENTQFGHLYEWNYRNQTSFYQDHCGKIDGSAGEFFPSRVPKTSITLFSGDLCRVMILNYVEEVVVDNILGYKFTMGKEMLDNGTLYPENKCYCNGECVPSGMVNVSSCRFNSPAFGSLPHFYNADPYYTNLLDGLNPDKNKHEFFIVLEPMTGIPLEVNARLQINLLLQPFSAMPLFADVPRVFVPMLWFEQKVKIPGNEAFNLKLLLNLPVICISIGVLLIVSSLLIIFFVFYKICTTNICGRKKKNRYLYPEQQVPLKSKDQFPNIQIKHKEDIS